MAAALERLRTLPFEDLGFARVDHHRQLRQSFPEVVFATGKSLEQVRGILTSLSARSDHILVTRLAPEMPRPSRPLSRRPLLSRLPDPDPDPGGNPRPGPGSHPGDLRRHLGYARGRRGPVTAESWATGRKPYDVGVAGLHRLLAHQELLAQATCFIVVAGMEGALPSVVAGLVDRPVIAVPTSIGYGATFGGLAALLAMLNSCATGLAVVNIDNGFGAGYLAALINRKD